MRAFSGAVHVLCVATVFMVAPRVHAQASPANAAIAEQLFRDAKALFAKKDYERACPKFAESLRLDPTLGTELNLARCHQEWGHTASAWGEYVDVARKADAAGDVDRAKAAKDLAAALEGKLSRVAFVAPNPPPDFKLTIDGEERAASLIGSAAPIDPGPHTIVATAMGMKTWTKAITVEKGPSTASIEVVMEKEQPAPAPLPAPPPAGPVASGEPSGHPRTLAYVLFGVGGVGLATGSVFGALTFGKKSDAQQCQPQCPAGENGRLGTAQHAYSTAQTDALISTIGFGVGLVAAAAGIYWFVTAAPAADPKQGTRGLRVVPQVGTTGFAITLSSSL